MYIRMRRTVLLNLPQHIIQTHTDCHRDILMLGIRQLDLPLATPSNMCSRSSFSLGSNVLKKTSRTKWLLSDIDIGNFLHREKVSVDTKWIEEGEGSGTNRREAVPWLKNVTSYGTFFQPAKASVFLAVKWGKDRTCLRGVVRTEWHNTCKAVNALPSVT